VTWGWFAVLISIYSEVLSERHLFGAPNELHESIAWLLAGSMAMSAAGSFRRERESGVLELLLVSPVGEKRVISGRLGGLWSQFAPAVGLLLVVWAYCSTFLPNGGRPTTFCFFLTTFLTVPVFGLYFSLRCRGFLAAFLFTLAGGLALPLVLGEALRTIWLWWVHHAEPYALPDWDLSPSWLGAIWQMFLALVCCRLIHRRLIKRAFPLERT
jgi:ABC-type transport system involved in multi-copper enzyme maturation permease subunit